MMISTSRGRQFARPVDKPPVSDDDRLEATLRSLTEAARAAEMMITGDGRVSEADAAALLGVESDTLAKRRSEGKAPRSYKLPVGAGRVSYRLLDLAVWIESHGENI